MTRSARPDNWQDLLAGHALGNLSPQEAESLRQVLTDHPDLTAEVDRLQEVLALMPYDVTDHEPPTHLRDSILAAAQADEPPLRLFQEPARKRSPIRWLALGSAVAAAACLALAVENYRLRQEADSNRPIIAALQQPNAQLYALQGTENAAGASGSIVITPDQRQVLVVVQNLPQLPQGRAYRLWAMPKNSQPAFCGQFNTSTSGTVSTLWVVDQAACSAPTQLLITDESATAPPVPQGDLVMQSRA